MAHTPPEGFEHFSTVTSDFGEADSWYQLVGPLFQADDNQAGAVRLGFHSEARHLNYLKQVHGGMMSAFMDYVLWTTARSVWPGAAVVTISMNIDFVAICPVDAWIVGTGDLIRAGKSVAFVKAAAVANGNVVVHATGSYRKISTS